MANFNDMCFTPVEFARLAKIDKEYVPALENLGMLEVVRKRVGNVDRKMITLESAQRYFKMLREFDTDQVPGRQGDQLNEEDTQIRDEAIAAGSGDFAAGEPIPVEAMQMAEEAADRVLPNADVELPMEATEMAPEEAPAAEEEMSEEDQYNEKVLAAAATVFDSGLPRRKTQMFYNVKGGTGKSTLTAQYVMRSAMEGLRVLALDLDGQGHLTVNLDILDAHERPTVYDILINDLPMSEAILNVAPGLDLVPANLGLCNIEIPLNQKNRREYRLIEAIESIADQYDLIVADTNPAASILNCSMLVAADLVNVVCATNPLSFHGMSLVMSTIEELKREFRKELDVRIIPNMYDNREVISQEVLGELRSQFPEECAKTVVNRSADLNEATKRRASVWDVSSKGVAAEDISKLSHELLHL